MYTSAPIHHFNAEKTPKKEHAQTAEQITSAKDLGTLGRELRSAKRFSFGE